MMETLQAVFPASHFTLLAVIVLLPLIGAFANGVFGGRAGKEAVTLMGLATVGGSFVLSVVTFLMLRAEQTGDQAARFVWEGWKWVSLSRIGEMDMIRAASSADSLELTVALSVDALSGTMALIVTGVGFLIHLYSTKYMAEDPGYHRFFAYLNLFIFAMLVLILGDNLPVLFVGWEGVGLCSYLLIGFWYGDQVNAAAGKKAFITNRIGDFGLLVAMALLVKYTGALSWDGIENNSSGLLTAVTVWSVPFLQDSESLQWLAGPHQVSAATLVGLALFLGCAGKSAQFPLYVWLPDAMAGPTPVSALIHAATMVTAGVYLVCRMAPVFVLSPAAMLVIAGVGAFTAILAASIAFVQNDIKKVLAYSTVSQLGYMFLGVGVGAFTAGFFHVLTHAFFKACLFLGAGSVIHAMHARIHDTAASQDVRNMGGLRQYLPTTHWTFAASVLAIIGTPLTSGFFSKDAILLGSFTNSIQAPRDGVLQSQLGPVELFQWPEWAPSVLLAMGVIGAVMTAFYMVRLYILTFMGDFKGWTIVPGWTPPADAAHGHGHGHHASSDPLEGAEPHESPWQMTFPLVVLGLLALFAGFLNAHFLHIHAMDDWLAPVFRTARRAVEVNEEANESLVMGLAIAAFFAGTIGAYWVFVQQRGEPAKDFAERFPAFHSLLVDKWRVDELYDELVIGTVDFIADICVWVDVYIVDGIVAGATSWFVRASGHLLRLIQNGRVPVYGAAMVVGLAGMGWFLVMPHAEAVVDADPEAGRFELTAAPGLGYAYRWDADGDEQYDSEEFGDRASIEVALGSAEPERVVRLQVRNAFGHTSERKFTLRRPTSESSEEAALGGEPNPVRMARSAAAREEGR